MATFALFSILTVQFAGFGLPQQAGALYSSNRLPATWRFSLIVAGLLAAGVVVLAGAGIAVLFGVSPTVVAAILFVALLALISPTAGAARRLLLADGRSGVEACVALAASVLGASLALWGALTEQVHIAVASQASVALFASVLLIAALGRRPASTSSSHSQVSAVAPLRLFSGAKFVPAGLLFIVSGYAEIISLNMVGSQAAVGVAAVALSIAAPITQVSQAMAAAIYGRTAQAERSGSAQIGPSSIARLSLPSIGVTGVFVVMIGPPLMVPLFGDELQGKHGIVYLFIAAQLLSAFHLSLVNSLEALGFPTRTFVTQLAGLVTFVSFMGVGHWLAADTLAVVAWASLSAAFGRVGTTLWIWPPDRRAQATP